MKLIFSRLGLQILLLWFLLALALVYAMPPANPGSLLLMLAASFICSNLIGLCLRFHHAISWLKSKLRGSSQLSQSRTKLLVHDIQTEAIMTNNGGMAEDYDAFFSYNSHDRALAKTLLERLKASGLKIWIDENSVPGVQATREIEDAINRSGSMIVALGPSGVGRYQADEINLAQNLARKIQRPVIPCWLPGYQEANQLTFLDERVRVDFRQGYSQHSIDRLISGIRGNSQHVPLALTTSQVPMRWILIAGTSEPGIPDAMKSFCTELATQIADADWGLVTGGWPGIDHLVATAFASTVQTQGQRLSAKLVQIMESNRLPLSPAGRLVKLGSDDEAWRHSIDRADAIILVGGVGGTYETGELAASVGKPVFPVADTRLGEDGHSDAYNFYLQTLDRWDRQPMSRYLSKEEYEDLSGPMSSVTPPLISLIQTYFSRLGASAELSANPSKPPQNGLS